MSSTEICFDNDKIFSSVTFEGLIIHENGIAVDVNNSLTNIVGYDKDELLRKDLVALLVHPDYHSIVYENIKNQSENPYTVIGIKKDGRQFYAELQSKNTSYEGRKIRVTAVRDVSTKVDYEERIKILYTAIEQSVNTVVITDKNGNIKYANPKFSSLTGYTLEESIGQNPKILKTDHQYPDNFFKNLWETISRGDSWEGEFLNKKKNGELYWEAAKISPVKNDQNEITAYIAIKEDITKFKNLMQSLKESEDKLKTIFEILPEGISITDEEGNIVDCNESSEKLLGVTKQQHISRKYDSVTWEIIRPDMTIMPPEEFASAIALSKNIIVRDVEMGIKHADGSITWINVNAAPIPLKNYGVVISYSDITKRKTAEEELKKSHDLLRELNATKDKFFSLIAHDLKNSLGSFMSASSMLSDNFDDFSQSEQKDIIDLMKVSSVSLYQMLENLLLWARSQRGIIEYRPEIIRFFNLTESVIDSVRHIFKSKNISLENKVASAIIAYADKFMIETTIRNLLTNAVKFSNANSNVEIISDDMKINSIHYIKIGVRDFGVGMKKDEVEKLFKFETGFSRKGTSGESGTGLGLTICKEFIEKNNGSIWAESEIGKGSTFYFTIPKIISR